MKKLMIAAAVIIACVLLISDKIEPHREATQALQRQADERSSSNSLSKDGVKTENLKCLHYREEDFMVSVNLVAQKQLEDPHIKGGVIPHHLLADRIIATFFKTAAYYNPNIEVVVIVAPNHNRIGNEKIQTGLWSWETPFGILEAESSIVNKLSSEYNAGASFKLLQEEHSISSLVPYVKYFFPESKIVPILLHGNYGLENSYTLGEKIKSLVHDKKYIIIGSIDFSHYLPVEKADKMDEITIEAIRERDLTALSRMGNDNLDSPPSIITLLSAMEKAGANSMAVLDHSNSARISGTESNSTTSYFSIVFSGE